MKNTLVVLTLIGTIASTQAASLFDVTAVAGKSEKEVTKVLGKPGTCSKSKYGPKCEYKEGQLEVVFIKGRADWITVNALGKVPFDDDAITALGLAQRRPTVAMPTVKRWENVQGLLSVSVFKGNPGSDYAYVKAYTP
jgi:hypothetical protein